MEKTIIRGVVKSLPTQNVQQQRLAQKKFEEERIKHTAAYAELMKEGSSADTPKDQSSNNTEGQSGESAADKEDEADDIYLINKWKMEANLYKEFSRVNEDNQVVSAMRGTSDLTFITSHEGWTSMFTLFTSKSDNKGTTLTLLTRKPVREYDRKVEELQMLVENGSPLMDIIQNVCWKIIP